MRTLENLLSTNDYLNGTMRPLPSRPAPRAFLKLSARPLFWIALLVVVVGSIALPALFALPVVGALAKGVR